jgi:hypothetical protein
MYESRADILAGKYVLAIGRKLSALAARRVKFISSSTISFGRMSTPAASRAR